MSKNNPSPTTNYTDYTNLKEEIAVDSDSISLSVAEGVIWKQTIRVPERSGTLSEVEGPRVEETLKSKS